MKSIPALGAILFSAFTFAAENTIPANQQVLVLRRDTLPNATHDMRATLLLVDENGEHEKLIYDTATNMASPHDHGIRWDLWSMQWSSDAKLLAFIAEEDHCGSGVLTVVNEETGEVQRVESPKADFFELAWSPSGQIAFPSGNNVALVGIQPNHSVEVALLPTNDLPRKFAWSPRDSLLAAVTDGQLLLLHVNEKEYYAEQLEKNDVEMACAPAWSPDGKRIAFMTHRTLGDFKDLNAKTEYKLATIIVDGKDKRVSDQMNTGEIEWSRDGKLIRTGEQILIASNLKPFLKSFNPADHYNRSPQLSPDNSKRIVFSKTPDEFQIASEKGNHAVVIRGAAIGWVPAKR